MTDQRGAAEARLLHAERALEALGRDLRDHQRALTNLGQEVWALWEDAGSVAQGVPVPTPTPTPTATLPVCCAGITPGVTIPFVDSIWGSGNLTWDGSANWIGWLSGLSWPGSGPCGAVTIAVQYVLTSGAAFAVNWIVNSTSGCPVSSTPMTAPGAGQSWASSAGVGLYYYCDTTPETAGYSMGTTAVELLLRTGHASETIAMTFTGSTATSSTSDFAGVCTCLPTSLTLTDSVYGTCNLTYNPIIQSWVGCRTVTYAGTVNCTAGTIAIQYTLQGNPASASWLLVVAWPEHVVAGHDCPIPSTTCASVLNASRQVAATISCSGTTTWSFGNSANSPWPAAGAATCSIPF
jgi:hypothetical protein